MQHPPPLRPLTGQTELAGPVTTPERIESLDVLRGLAVLGILVMNVQSFSMIQAAYVNPYAWGDLSGANYWVWLLSHVLADGKFITIFSILFGAGIVLMAGRQELTGRSPAGRLYRRMGVLAGIGVLHAYLFWYGDILFTYAICGMVVYLCRGWRPTLLLVVGLLGLAWGWSLWAMVEWSMAYWPDEIIEEFRLSYDPSPEMIAAELAAYRGGWIEQMSHRLPAALELQIYGLVLLTLWWTGGMMLIGMGLFKLGVLTASASTKVYLAMIAVGAFGVVLTISNAVRIVPPDGNPPGDVFLMGAGFEYWSGLIVGLGWIGGTMLICRQGLLGGVQRCLAAVGRMALTNYLLQTIICTTIFYGHGLGLFGRVERTGQIGIVAAVWAVQLVLSPLWLHYFRYGPVEWVWRMLTYGRAPAMRREK